ncbi:ADP-ribosylglycohydrolase family protein [Propionivibrio limicola]|uniref:ADP-ribosylglycohydrolase family protein n=1 Tax=Propionivibrio limicola TaxID=167645 RepID=UPI0014790E3B|nr:ADP-ribosylglycohydrolase family protein [Propionivibrio limicola]
MHNNFSSLRMRDTAEGAIMGALIGDAAGATLEFLGHKPSANEVRAALCMSGGGVWQTAPGQITDDGELILALCHALRDRDLYPPTRAARFYRRWYLSRPFDIGGATSAALCEGDLDDHELAELVSNNALASNANSKANGSLMRIAPLGVWSHRLDIESTVNAARSDARLTHPNPSCQWANAAYVIAIRHLMLNHGDHRGAFAAAHGVLDAVEAREVRAWLQEAERGDLPAFYPSAGFVRIAFTHAFHHLLNKTSYYEALAIILSGGGDTDTNACIVGGLLGALHGAQGIPELMRSALLNCDVKKGQLRPEWLQTRYVDPLIGGLIPA